MHLRYLKLRKTSFFSEIQSVKVLFVFLLFLIIFLKLCRYFNQNWYVYFLHAKFEFNLSLTPTWRGHYVVVFLLIWCVVSYFCWLTLNLHAKNISLSFSRGMVEVATTVVCSDFYIHFSREIERKCFFFT